MARLGRLFSQGRRVRTDGLPGFLMLHALGGMKGWRRWTLRHRQEVAHRRLGSTSRWRSFPTTASPARCCAAGGS
jgi:hypothetical protein